MIFFLKPHGQTKITVQFIGEISVKKPFRISTGTAKRCNQR
jgi:hypothetical protein